MNAAGKITGVALELSVRPLTPYRLVRVELVDEIAAQGNTVATCRVLDAEGLPLGDTVFLAWPWPDLSEFARPGNQNGQHMITNTYTPPNLGPLALCLRDAAGQIASDVAGGLGLPHGHHVSFVVTWQLRAAGTGGGEDPDPEPAPGDGLATAVTRVAVALERLVAHFGA